MGLPSTNEASVDMLTESSWEPGADEDNVEVQVFSTIFRFSTSFNCDTTTIDFEKKWMEYVSALPTPLVTHFFTPTKPPVIVDNGTTESPTTLTPEHTLEPQEEQPEAEPN